MDYSNILSSGKLVYASCQSDSRLREWLLGSVQLKVSFYKQVALEKTDLLICQLLHEAGGSMSKQQLGLTLGFDIATTELNGQKYYLDTADVSMFERLLHSVHIWNLIAIDSISSIQEEVDDVETTSGKLQPENTDNSIESVVRLTRIGELALIRCVKFEFYKGLAIVYSNYLKTGDPVKDATFPYIDELGITASLEAVDLEQINIDTIDIEATSEWIGRLTAQMTEQSDIHFYSAIPQNKILSMKYIAMDIRLYEYGGEYYPMVFNGKTFCSNATDILNVVQNSGPKNVKIKRAFYYKLINDSNALFTSQEINKFWDILDYNEYVLLLKDQRLDWRDTDLFDLITNSEYCDSSVWDTISLICPLDVVKEHVETCQDKLDWNTLSLRIDIPFILEHQEYSWNYSSILERDEVHIEDAQSMLLIPALTENVWDWDVVEKYLTIDFVRENIDKLNLDFYFLTSWLPNKELSLLLSHSDKAWNWDYATSLFSVEEIEKNLEVLQPHLNITHFLDRCFTNEANKEYVIHSEILLNFIRQVAKTDRLNAFSLRERSYYLWCDDVIDFFECTGVLKWKSQHYAKGFAQFPFVVWDDVFFAKYHSKLTESEDFTFVSGQIKTMALIENFPDFRWDWTALSSNRDIALDKQFIESYSSKIDIAAWSSIASTFMVEEYFDQLNLRGALYQQEYKEIISNKVSYEFIKSHSSLPWENSIFTNCCARLAAADARLLYDYKDRWDWDIISSLVSVETILTNITLPWTDRAISHAVCSSVEHTATLIEEHVERIDWGIVSEKICYSAFEQIVDNYYESLDWSVINRRFSSQFSNELLTTETIQNKIDWDAVSNNIPEIELSKELVAHPEKINWIIATRRLCESMTLEQLTNVNNIEQWDWEYLSKNLPLTVLKDALWFPELRWSWSAVTKRLDADFIFDNLSACQDKWDWNVIWLFQFSKDFLTSRINELPTKLNDLSEDVAQEQWTATTKVLGNSEILSIYKQCTPNEGYFWNYRVVYQDIDNIESFVLASHNYIDWNALSGCNAANSYFNYDSDVFDIRIWKSVVKKRLENPLFRWNYSALTQLNNIQREFSIFYRINQEVWDWKYISSFGLCLTDKYNGEANLRKYKDRIDFSLLSKRTDIEFTEDLISSFVDELWDWAALSANPSVRITIRYVFEHKEKLWDWNAVSKNTAIRWEPKTPRSIYQQIFKNKEIVSVFDWEFFVSRTDVVFDTKILSLIHRYITELWPLLTSNKRFVPSLEVLELAEGDNVNLNSLDWSAIAESKYIIKFKTDEEKHSVAVLDFIKKYVSLLDWGKLTQNHMFDINNSSVVSEFKNFVDWNHITSEFEKDNISFICKFKTHLDWSILNERFDYQLLNEDLLNKLKEYLNWTKVSALGFSFTKDLIDQYEGYWDWSMLLDNEDFKRVCTDDMLVPYKTKLNVAEFYKRFKRNDVKIYHFTHLFNVIEVLKSKKVLSRNKAIELGLLKYDSAGGVVGRTAKAHPFARFYFRPNTPTQFYNECLGWDVEMITRWGKSYYPQAVNLGLPKCPIPVFLEFDLNEVLIKMPQLCYYSDGNLQSNYATVYKVEDSPLNMRMKYLYNNMGDAFDITLNRGPWNRGLFNSILEDIKNQSQQEFLIKEQFDFSSIQSLIIHCYDDYTADMLRRYLGEDRIADKIVVGGGCFSYDNKELNFKYQEEDQTLQLSSNYNGQGDAYFLVKGDVEIINTNNIKRQTSGGVIIYPEVEIKTTDQPYEIFFVDLRARTKEWLIFSTTEGNENSSILQISDSIKDAVDKFEEEMSSIPLQLAKDLFYSHMVNSHHGIAHTARVLFATFLIVKFLPNLTKEEQYACYLAAIIHDLGKTSDREGKIHGYNSMKLYKGKIEMFVSDNRLQKRILNAIQYHSIDDNETPIEIRQDIIWQILKDSDALDRSRFSGRGCDKSFLRLPLFKGNIGEEILCLTQYLPSWTQNLVWNNPYCELSQIINKNIK